MIRRIALLVGLLAVTACADPEVADRTRLMETLRNEPDRAKHIPLMTAYAERQSARKRALERVDRMDVHCVGRRRIRCHTHWN